MLLLLIVLLPFLGAALIAAVPNHRRDRAAALAGVITFAAAVPLAIAAGAVFEGEVLRASWAWMPAIGVDFSLRMDGLAMMFAMLIIGIGLLIVLYARYYLGSAEASARFFAFLLAFMGSMLGIVLSGNIVLMAVFWELTSLTSFLLIGYWMHRADAREGARMALTITGAGGLALLGGVLLLGHIVGSYDLDHVLAAGAAVKAHPLYLPTLVLILLGAFTKSAQFPFHVWLPQAMAAPTPVSAYLHSATMVKAGVFLLARFHPVLAGTDAWFFIVTTAGLLTLLVCAWIALFQHDLKGLLAYSTLSHLGLITLLLGLYAPLAAVAAVFHILNHAAFKASLFMAAGIIDHETGSRDMRKLSGLRRHMPHTAALAMVAAAAMAGVPLLNGFLSKEMFFAETLSIEGYGAYRWVTPIAATLAGIFSVAYSTRFIHDVFFAGEPTGLERTPHDPPRWMKVPVEVLVVVCLAVGILPAHTVAPLLDVAARDVLGGSVPEYSLAIWHGFNLPLLMSLVATTGGVILYFLLLRYAGLHQLDFRPHGRRAFDAIMHWLTVFAARLAAVAFDVRLQRHLAALMIAGLVAAAFPFLSRPLASGPLQGSPATGAGWLIWAMGCAAAVGTVVMHRSRLVAVILLGAVGLMVSLTFVHYSAPDLALTQLLVEMISILLMMLALRYLPEHGRPERSGARRARDLMLSVAAGGGLAALVWAVLTRPQSTISGYYLENSYTLGGGNNAVNVVLVDFRGFDTLGEIAVLGIAGLIVFALLRALPIAPAHRREPSADRHPVILSLASDLLLPLATLVSVYFFLRGHNLPGGGFIGGLVFSIALLLQYVSRGAGFVNDRFAPRYARTVALGLLFAGLTGIGSMLVGHPFLTSHTPHPILPILGEVPLASAMIFDLGVYLTVIGGSMLALASLGQASEREERA
ncbi:MAG: monovalent cation/H+ antiporter subunit A [Gammaproteobacteria bacterium]